MYLVAGHLLRRPAPFERLAALPDDVGYRVHLHREPEFWGIETFGKKFKKEWPAFTQVVLDRRLSRRVERAMPTYAAVVRAIQSAGISVPEVHGALDLGLAMSSLLATKLLTFVADDDTLNFACVCEKGRITRLRGLFDQCELFAARSRISVRPLRDPEDPDWGPTDDLRSVGVVAGVSLGRVVDVDTRLHGIVLDESRAFLRLSKPVLGIGSFDLEESPLELITERTRKPRK